MCTRRTTVGSTREVWWLLKSQTQKRRKVTSVVKNRRLGAASQPSEPARLQVADLRQSILVHCMSIVLLEVALLIGETKWVVNDTTVHRWPLGRSTLLTACAISSLRSLKMAKELVHRKLPLILNLHSIKWAKSRMLHPRVLNALKIQTRSSMSGS